MESELIILAETGAAALVKAMATDLWPSARRTVTALFHRNAPQREAAIEAQLDNNVAFVTDAESPDDARREVFGFWVLELAALLRRDPSCRGALAQLAEDLCNTLTDNYPPSNLAQTNTAHDHGTIFATQSGDQHNHAPGPATGSIETD
jgi:hypothetical protein